MECVAMAYLLDQLEDSSAESRANFLGTIILDKQLVKQ